MNWKYCREELAHTFEEWGVNGNHNQHLEFRKSVYEEAKRMIETGSTPTNYSKLKNLTFPTESTKAVEHVCRSDLREKLPDSHRYLLEDKLASIVDDKGCMMPFFRVYAKNTVICYKRQPEFKGFSIRNELDPFHRFSFRQVSQAELWYNRWFLSGVDSNAGTIFEARLACYALQSEACFECKYRNTLRWNGGVGASWQDLVCIQCESMYEVKTKATMEKIEREFKYNSIRAGSFSRYCSLRNSLKQGQKMFLVVLPRLPTFDRSGKKECFPVYIAEIDRVLPRVGRMTFRKPSLLQSVVSVKLITKRLWFNLPEAKGILYRDCMKSLFVQEFSQQVLDRLDAEYVVFDDDEEESDGDQPVQVSKEERIKSKSDEARNEEGNCRLERLRADLESIKVGDDECDDWESMYE